MIMFIGLIHFIREGEHDVLRTMIQNIYAEMSKLLRSLVGAQSQVLEEEALVAHVVFSDWVSYHEKGHGVHY
jgi:hypothetical protein